MNISEEVLDQTWSRRPFILLDGGTLPDHSDRAEVQVIIGYALIDSVSPAKKGGRSAQVTLAIKRLSNPLSGFVNIDSDVYRLCVEAHEKAQPVLFRIEKQRKPGVDRTTPITKLTETIKTAQDSINKLLVAVKYAKEDEWSTSQQLTNPEEDSKESGEVQPASSISQKETGTPKKSGKAHVAPWEDERVENQPWFKLNPDGTVNPGSNIITALVSTASFASEYVKSSGLDLTPAEEFAFAQILMSVADAAQVDIYDQKLETADPTLGSHTRARSIVFDCVKHRIPPTEKILKDKVAAAEYEDNLRNTVLKIWRWAIRTIETRY